MQPLIQDLRHYLAQQRYRLLVARGRDALPAGFHSQSSTSGARPCSVAPGVPAPGSSTRTPLVVRLSSHDRCGVTTADRGSRHDVDRVTAVARAALGHKVFTAEFERGKELGIATVESARTSA